MRVLVNAAQHILGGAVTHLREVLPRLAAIDPNDSYLMIVPRQVGDLALPPNATMRFLSTPFSGIIEYGSRFLWENAALPVVAGRFKPDVVFLPVVSSLLWGRHRAVGMFRNAAPFDQEWIEASPFFGGLRGRILARVALRQCRRMAATICVSDYGRHLLVSRDPTLGDRTPVVRHGVRAVGAGVPGADKLILEALEIRRPFVLMVGHLLRFRHVVEAAQGFLEWAATNHDVDLVIAGERVERDYVAEVERVAGRSESRIRLLGMVPAKDLPALYRSATAFLFASRCEVCPNSVLEAMSHGLPIACSDVPPVREAAGEAALYFNPRDPASVGQTLGRLLGDRALAQRLGRAAKERAARFTWDETARRTHAVLAAVANGHPLPLA